MELPPLPVNVLCGYLGSGKTTLLNRLLAQGHERVLVMVNDFGEVAVDAALISRRSADTIQLSNGCICCSMAGGMFDAFDRALSWRGKVNRLLIEASGVAEPARLTAFARAEPDLDCRAAVVVVDPQSLETRLADRRIGGVVARQIEGADVAFLSRRDKVDDASLGRATDRLLQINPSLSMVGTDRDLIAALDGPHNDVSISPLAGAVAHADIFTRMTVLSDVAPLRNRVYQLLTQAAPHLHRAKGFVRFADESGFLLVQFAAGELAVTPPPNDPGPGPAMRMVLIGTDRGVLEKIRDGLQCATRPIPS